MKLEYAAKQNLGFGTTNEERYESNYQEHYGIGIGIFFLIGGIANLSMIPSPTWFAALDLIVAYLPMGWLGGRVAASLGK